MHLLLRRLLPIVILLGCCSSPGLASPIPETAPEQDNERNTLADLANPGPDSSEPNLKKLIVFGVEPSWALRVQEGKFQFYLSDPNTPDQAWPTPTSIKAENRPHTWAYPLGPETVLILRKASCSDTMSDNRYPYQALVLVNGTLLDGCGEIRE